MSTSLIFCNYCGAANQSSVPACFACGQTLSVEIEAPATRTLHGGRYRIVSTLGQGGYGAVYKAIDTGQNNQLVALKSVNLRGLKTNEIIEATETFNRELVFLSELSHPNLPHLREHFSDPEHWYLVMDFIDGQTLEEYQQKRGGRLALPEVIAIAMDLCLVLNYLHTRQPPVIFRDVKPSNIMRTPVGRIFLIDFGIARRFRPGQRQDTTRLGSPGYAAPEQYGQAQTSPQTDIYGLGITLWQLVSGQDPVNTPITREAITTSNLDLPHASELTDLLAQMLHPDAQQRPVNIREVRERLRALDIQGRVGYRPLPTYPQTVVLPNALTPIASTPSFTPAIGMSQSTQQQYLVQPASVSPKQKISRRNALLGITGALAIAGGFAWYHQTTDPISVSYTGHNSQVLAVAWAPQGGVVASGDQEGLIQIWDAASGQTRRTLRNERLWGKANTLSWSPDGEALVAGYDRAIVLWNIRQNGPLEVWRQPNGLAAWSPDGTYIAILNQASFADPVIDILDAQTYSTAFPSLPVQAPLAALAWSPNSSQIAASYGKSPLPMQIWNLPGSSAFLPGPGPSTSITQFDTTALAWSPDGAWISLGNAHGQVETFSMADGTMNDSFAVQQAISALAWAPYNTGWGVSTADTSGTITVALVREQRKTHQFTDQPLWSLSWSPDGQALASGGADTVVRIWQIHT